MSNFTTKLFSFFALLASWQAYAQPTVTSPTVTAISHNGATLGGTASGGSISARGTAWKTSSPVAVTDNPQVEGTGSGTFTDARTGLPAATQIFYIAYATNGGGTGKSSEGSFYTLATPASGQPATFSASANTTIQIGLAFTAANDPAVVADGYVIYRHGGTTAPDLSDLLNGAVPPPTLADGSTLIVTTTNSATTQNDAVTAGNIYTYTIVPFTKGSNNATYNFLKVGALSDIASTNSPAISSPTHTNITHQSADLGGNIATEYNIIQERGTVWKTATGVTIGDNKLIEGGSSDGVFSHTRSPLSSATQYFYKAFVKTALGTVLSSENSFYTLKTPPTGQPASFTAAATSGTAIDLTFPAAATVGADGYIILRKAGSLPDATVIQNGLDPAGNVSNLPGGTSLLTFIAGDPIPKPDAGLTTGTTYYYVLIPYTFSAASTQTYNYLKAGALSDSDTPSNGVAISTLLTGYVCDGSFSPMSDLVITESSKGDFSTSGTLILSFAGSGYIFKPGPLPTPGFTASANITSASAVADYSSITITYSVSGTNKTDAITITGIQAQTSAPGNAASNIIKTGGTATINGASVGKVFGSINSIAASTQTFTFCKNAAITGTVATVPGGAGVKWYTNAALTTPVTPSIDGNPSPSVASLNFNTNTATTINFYAKAPTSCVSVVTIIINPRPRIAPGADLTGASANCSGANVTLGGSPSLVVPTVSGTYTYAWTASWSGSPAPIPPGAITYVGGTSSTSPNPIVTLVNTGSSNATFTFSLVVTDPNLCTSEADVPADGITKDIEVTQAITPQLTQPSSTVFTTNTPAVELQASPVGGVFSGIGVVHTTVGSPATDIYKFAANLAYDNTQGLPQNYNLYYTFTQGTCQITHDFGPIMTISDQLFSSIANEYCSSEHQTPAPFGSKVLLDATASAYAAVLSSVNSWNTSSRYYYAPMNAYSTTLTTWSAATIYGIGNTVKYNGLAYIAVAASTNVTPGTNAAVWSEDTRLKVTFKGTVRNYYEGYYGGNLSGSTIVTTGSTYTVSSSPALTQFEFLTNVNYKDCPDCEYSLPYYYMDFVNVNDIDLLMPDWLSTNYYYPGSVVKVGSTYYRLLLTYNDNPYYSYNQDPTTNPTVWQNLGSNFDNGSRYKNGSASGMAARGQFVAVHKNPLASFTGLTSGLVNATEFCNVSTTYTLIGNSGGVFGLGNFDLSYDGTGAGANGTFQARPGLVSGSPAPGQATFNGATAYSGNPLGAKLFYVRYFVDPGTKGSTGQACIGSSVQTIHVNALPNISIDPVPTYTDHFCFSDPAVAIKANSSFPITLSGFGVTDQGNGNGKFTPASGITDLAATTGIIYDYTTRPAISVVAQTVDNNGCVGQTSSPFVVNPKPPAAFTAFPTNLCFTTTPFDIDGQQTFAYWDIDYKDVVNTDHLGNVNTAQPDIMGFSPANLFNRAVNTFGANALATLSFDFKYTSFDPDKCLNTLPPVNVKIAPQIPVAIAGINDNEEFCSNLTPARQVTLSPTGGSLTVTRNGIAVPPPTVVAGQFFFSPIPLDGGDYVFNYDVITGNNCSNPTTTHVKVLASPVADFLAPPKCDGDVIAFNANGTQNINGTPTYSWTFEGQQVNGQNTTHKFSGVGTYTVGLDVSYPPAGTTNTICRSVLSLDQYVGLIPQVDFEIADVCENDKTKFTSTSTVTPISQAQWDFGDGNTLTFGGVNQAVPVSPSMSGTFGNPEHSFAGANTYTVTLTGRTSALTGNCSNTKTRSVSILKYLHGYNATNPYAMKALNGEDGFWVVEDKRTNATWEFGAPNKAVIKSPDKSWVTSVSGVYKSKDVSYMNSPCLDLGAFSRPSISVNIRYNSDPGKDGAVMQYSTDGGKNWVRLGSIGSGLNWYNEQGISASPGGQNAFGWSGKEQADWEVAKHSLSDVAGNNKVRFRIAFASDEKDTLDGFAFNDVKIEERNRITLIESFTNINAADAGPNRAAFQAIPDGETVKIEYHTPSPGTDPIYLQNPDDFNSRAAFYGLTNTNVSIPRGFIDGSSQGTFNSPWATQYQPLRSLVSAPFAISLENPASTNPDEITVKVTLTALENIVADKLDLQIAVIEKQVGSDKFILRKLLPSAAGTRIVTPLAKNATTTLTQTWPTKNIVSINELAVVAFVQDQASLNVLQSARLLTLPNPPTIVTGLELSMDSELIVAYPNPSDLELMIKLPAAAKQKTILRLTDQLGKSVHNSSFDVGEQSKTISTRDLAEGIYILRVEGKETLHKKVVVVHKQ